MKILIGNEYYYEEMDARVTVNCDNISKDWVVNNPDGTVNCYITCLGIHLKVNAKDLVEIK